jgi:hypothetical protein
VIRPGLRAEIRRLVLGEGWKIETVARRFGVHHSVALRRSQIFPLTTLDAYDFDYPKAIDRDVVARARSGQEHLASQAHRVPRPASCSSPTSSATCPSMPRGADLLYQGFNRR